MAYSAPPARTEISDTYPNPSNAVARVGFGKLWDYVTGLLGATGSPTAAKAALLVPIDVDFTNRIINGAMMIDQRNAGASVTPTSGQYLVDRWQALLTQASKFTVQQNAGAVTPPSGFTKYLGITSSSAYTVGAGDYFSVQQSIEGFNSSDLNWGSATAVSVTLSFWVRSSLTGTFGGCVENGTRARGYPFTFTISSANTWEYKTVTIAGDTSGTWATDNSASIIVQFGLGVGSTASGTAGAWAAGSFISATGATSVVGTNGATFYITGVQLEKGSTATSFDYRPYGTELALCQRYYEQTGGEVTYSTFGTGMCTSATQYYGYYAFKQKKRALPTLNTSGTAGNYQVFTAGGSGVALNAVPVLDAVNVTTDSAFITATVASGLTNGNGAMLRSSNTFSGFLGFNAEL